MCCKISKWLDSYTKWGFLLCIIFEYREKKKLTTRLWNGYALSTSSKTELNGFKMMDFAFRSISENVFMICLPFQQKNSKVLL